MDLISTHCSTCYSWTVCRAPLPAQVFCGVCDPNPPPPPPPLTENQRTDIERMFAEMLQQPAGEPQPEECDDDRHNVDEHCPTCGHRSECDECGDPAIGNYGDNLRPLCADCRDDGGFCSCGYVREECPYSSHDEDDE